MVEEIEEARALLRTKAALLDVPEHCIEGLVEFVAAGRPTGSFLEAVISNDLFDALGRADHVNRTRIFEIASWLFNHAPRASYGSREAYQQWIARGGCFGNAQSAAAVAP
jgi:hypothetical protein